MCECERDRVYVRKRKSVCGNCTKHSHTAGLFLKSSEERWVEYKAREEAKKEEEIEKEMRRQETGKEWKDVCTRKGNKEREGRK